MQFIINSKRHSLGICFLKEPLLVHISNSDVQVLFCFLMPTRTPHPRALHSSLPCATIWSGHRASTLLLWIWVSLLVKYIGLDNLNQNLWLNPNLPWEMLPPLSIYIHGIFLCIFNLLLLKFLKYHIMHPYTRSRDIVMYLRVKYFAKCRIWHFKTVMVTISTEQIWLFGNHQLDCSMWTATAG